MKKYVYIVLLPFLIFTGCTNTNDEDELAGPGGLVVNDFLAFVDESPANGSTIGTINASSTRGEVSYSITSQTPAGAIDVDILGTITVANTSLFVFNDNPQILATVEVSDGEETGQLSVTININEPGTTSFNIWTGAKTTFTKADGADPNTESNQDRLTDNVWITRGNSGGQIYNASVEASSSKSSSPSDTEWAVGTTADIADLTFLPFREAISPKSVAQVDLVLHLITDDVYIDVKFTQWSTGKRGGFAYERSTEPN